MLIKLVIIGVILLAGGIVFANEISQFLPETSADMIDSIKSNFGKIKDETVQNAETSVEGTIVTVSNEVNDIKERSTELLSENVKEVTDTTQKGIKEVTDSTQKGIIEVTDTTQKTIFGDNNKNTNSLEEHDDSSKTQDNENIVTKSNNKNTISFETLSLTTVQQSDNNIVLQYQDTSGKTISVSVILRTTERELFSGTFYSSMFETFVNDVSNTPYFIDLIIEHQEYGTITSSVYNPRDSPNTVINGVFSKS